MTIYDKLGVWIRWGVNYYEGPVEIEDITQELFNWVTKKTQDNHRFIRIHKRE